MDKKRIHHFSHKILKQIGNESVDRLFSLDIDYEMAVFYMGQHFLKKNLKNCLKLNYF